MLDNQTVYDRVKAHLLAQGRRSSDGGRCFYRGPDGFKCAIGALIPDRCYRPEWDRNSEGTGRGINGLRDEFGAIGVFGEPSTADTKLLIELQDLHDVPAPEEWADRLAELAEAWDLKP